MKKILLALVLFLVMGKGAEAVIYPKMGVYIGNYKVVNNNISGTNLLFNYHKEEVRNQVRTDLKKMNDDGVKKIRFMTAFFSNLNGQTWLPIPYDGGELPEPYRTNMINYFKDVKDSGFEELLVVFGGWGENQPGVMGGDRVKMDMIWQFVQKVRQIARENGPAIVSFDLQNEGGPQEGIKGWENGETIFNNSMDYVTELWRRYSITYGCDDASFGSIASAHFDVSFNKPLDNLVVAMQRSNTCMPKWFAFSIYAKSEEDAVQILDYLDKRLDNLGFGGSSVRITETYYEDEKIMRAVKQFVTNGKREVKDIFYWPLVEGIPNVAMTQSIPYTINAYKNNFPIILSGDFNRDNVVNLADFGFWKAKYLSGQMTLAEFGEWKRGYLR